MKPNLSRFSQATLALTLLVSALTPLATTQVPRTSVDPTQVVEAPVRLTPMSPTRGPLERDLAQTQAVLLARKMIRTPQESEELQNLLSDPELSKAAITTLRTPESGVLSIEREDRRMEAVDLLTQMTQWKENPQRIRVLHEVSELLTESVSSASVEASIRKSLIGDRVELYVLLYRQDPSLAKRVLRSVQGHPEERYYQFATGFYLREPIGKS